MNLQEIFYLVAIIFMVLSISLILVIAIIFLLIYKKVNQFQAFIMEKLASVTAPAEVAAGISVSIAKSILGKVRNFVDSKGQIHE